MQTASLRSLDSGCWRNYGNRRFLLAMLRMQDDGLLQLPPPRNGNNNGKPYLRRTQLAALQTPLGALRLQLVTGRQHSHLYNEYLARYHYLGYQPLCSVSGLLLGRPNRATCSSAGHPNTGRLGAITHCAALAIFLLAFFFSPITMPWAGSSGRGSLAIHC